MNPDSVSAQVPYIADGVSESTKASTTEVQAITSRKRIKSNAQRCREYRERKKLQNTMVQNILAERSDECSETDQLPFKKPKPKTDAERRKKYYEAQKLRNPKIKKIPKTAKQRNKECYYRKKLFQALNPLNHHSDVDAGSGFYDDHDEALVEDPEVPAGIEDPLAPTFLQIKEEPTDEEKVEPLQETEREELSLWVPRPVGERQTPEQLDKDIHSESTTFTCTECKFPSYGVTLTCLQCRNVQMCLRCDAEGRHSYHCLLKAPAMRHLDIVESYLPEVRRKFIILLKGTMNEEENSAMAADVKRKKEARRMRLDVLKEAMKEKKAKTKSTKAASKKPAPMPTEEQTSCAAEIATPPSVPSIQAQPSSTMSSFLSSWSESLAEQDLISEDPQPALIPPMTDLVFQTLEAPQLNVPIALTACTSEFTSPSISAASQLTSRVKRKADDPAGRKRQALDGDNILAEISQKVEDDVIDVTKVKTEPLDDRGNDPGDSIQGAFFIDYGSHRKPNF